MTDELIEKAKAVIEARPMTTRTLEEIEAELATKDKAIAHQACLLRVAPALLAIAQRQREEIKRLHGIVGEETASGLAPIQKRKRRVV